LNTFVNSTGGATSDMGLFKSRIVLTPKAVTFTVSGVPALAAGESVYVVGGNCTGCTDATGWEFGKWQTVEPYMVKMTPTGTANQYRATVYLHNNRSYEFKALKKNGGTPTWEAGGNNIVNTSATASANWNW
jgi:beta-amylase